MRDFVQVTGGGNCTIAAARDAMGIDWMTKNELNEAIPPAYTELIGRQLLEYQKSTRPAQIKFATPAQKNESANFSLQTLAG
jgi:DNA (cytosine-5)-methyltransferase 1